MKNWQWLVLISVPFFAFILAGCPWAGEDDYETGASGVISGVVGGVGSWELIAPWLSPGGRNQPPVGTPLVAAREQHTMVWTWPGTPRFIIWGGRGVGGYLTSGALWRQSTRVWSATPAVFTGGWYGGGLPPRTGHTAVWDGQEKIVFGGQGSDGTIYNSGAMYDPAGATWIYMSPPSSVYTRIGHTANWNGTRMLVFGGYGSASYSYYWWWTYTPATFLASLQIFNPTLNTWTNGSTSGEATPRWNHTSIWTGTELIVWGGSSASYLNNGRRYNFSTDSWSEMTLSRAPSARENHTAVFTGNGTNAWNNKMIIWGGGSPRPTNSGGIYDIALDQWLPVTDGITAPISRTNHTALWTNPGVDDDTIRFKRMIVWGGTDTDGNQLNSGGIYDPLTNTWQATQQSANPPPVRRRHTAVWTGTQMVIFGGYNGEDYLSDAWIYTPPAR
ncbi:MAG: kelch repeat-containing protein [Candidatus Brocadiia bacterium]